MQITLYSNFKKRINSTKQPTGGTNIDMTLKRPTSIENPVFILQNSNTVEAANYVKWGDHYYFISNKTYVNNDMVEVACSQDVLATFKSDIGSTSAFVEYATTGFNADILDPRISNTGVVTRGSNSAAVPIFRTNGRLILSVVGVNGIADRYWISESDLSSLGSKLSTSQFDDVQAEDLAKRFGNVQNCILGLTWIPFTMGAGVLTPIYLGCYNTGIQAAKIAPTQTVNETITISIPWQNSEVSRKSLETITLYLPCYGNVTLSASDFVGANSITIDVCGDSTGSITYTVHKPSGDLMYYNANASAEIPVTQFAQSPIGMVAGLASELFSLDAYTGFSNNKGATKGLSDFFGRLVNVHSSTSCTGGQGSISLGYAAIEHSNIVITNSSYQFSETQPNMATNYGRPVFANKTLSTLSGYIKCTGASVNIEGFEDDKNAINVFLNSGFFYE